MKKAKKKAFTLTELLVVVIVIGVLAAVTLPTFNKVLETRKTTEAEDVLSALRTEQEYRCAMEKPYATDLNQLDAIASNTKKNFEYKVSTEGSGSNKKVTGSEAISQGKYNYMLRMPSYADGRICCDGPDCSRLNKDYPLCTDLKARADYKQVPANCAPDAERVDVPTGGDAPSHLCGPMPANLIEYKQCPAPTCGRQVRNPICDQSTSYQWKQSTEAEWDSSACSSKPDPKDTEYCEDKENSDECGTITYKTVCQKVPDENNWAWDRAVVDTNTCQKKEPDETHPCPDGTTSTKTYECKDHVWVEKWDPKECEEEKTYTCKSAAESGIYSCKGDFVYDSTQRSRKLSHVEPGFEDEEDNYISYEDYYENYCCKCPEGKVYGGNGFTCKTCQEARGRNYTYSGGRCVPIFKATKTDRHVSFGDRWGVYHMADTEWCWSCNATINAPTQISSCSYYGAPQEMCDEQCDPNQSTCMAACYDYGQELASGMERGFTAGSTGAVKCEHSCGFNCVPNDAPNNPYGSYEEAEGQYIWVYGFCSTDASNWCYMSTCSCTPATEYESAGASFCSSCGGVAQTGNSHTGGRQITSPAPDVRCVSEPGTTYDCMVPKVKYISGYTCGKMTAKGQCSGGYGYY